MPLLSDSVGFRKTVNDNSDEGDQAQNPSEDITSISVGTIGKVMQGGSRITGVIAPPPKIVFDPVDDTKSNTNSNQNSNSIQTLGPVSASIGTGLKSIITNPIIYIPLSLIIVSGIGYSVIKRK